MKTIVVGYDESESAERALLRAAELARFYDAKLIVTSVVPVLIKMGEGSDPEPIEIQQRLRELDVEAELVEAIGDPAEAIVEVAEQRVADLIVVGTREPSQIERELGHSVSEQVQRRAHCDVLIVH